MIKLKEEYRFAVANDPELIGKIASITNKKINTVEGWTKENNVSLTRADVLYTIQNKLLIDDVRTLTEFVEPQAEIKK